jgi:hypothetical protein
MEPQQMATVYTRNDVLHTYLVLMLAQNIFTSYESLEEACQQFTVMLI